MLHLVLFQPEIPHNTGAIGRLCLATGARLHLIRPLGFSLDDRHLKRAGLDYWPEVDVRQWDRWEDLKAAAGPGSEFYFIECGGTRAHWEADLGVDELYLVLGPETRGIPPSIIDESRRLTIPMQDGGTRSLNLATAAAIVLYEAVRQRQGATTGGQG
ncbi:MAG: tRNA (cytidine(34)-2'-O)-methyltransferase [Verrucomicrobiaceae bacterium]|nr:tRNA (cytidine(34)-2'-O)-methyltransferase [Verrucomicrobiaceae bacterium]